MQGEPINSGPATVAAAGWSSRDRGEAIAMLSGILAPHDLELREPRGAVHARLAHVTLESCNFADIRYGAPVRIRSRVPSDRCLIHAVTEGRSRIAARAGDICLQPGMIHVSAPGAPIDIEHGPASRHLTASLSMDAWSAIAGWSHDAALPVFNASSAPAWRDLASFVLGWAQLGGSGFGTAAERLDGLVRAFLTDSLALGADAARARAVQPWYVMRARQVMLDAVRQGCDPIGLADVARAIGVSMRTLQQGFRTAAARTFGEELRELRLCELDRQLAAARPDDDVTAIMQSCGITSMGRFAGYYRDRFGLLPSQRLRSRQGH
ncbi:AraC family transcriptional regulator [Novosphingobium sp. RD2P27]|uniref:AraC family transcriptional regulator n=1 Tax=Novosphingobium kalidii TaxID=3230299 RepID=A0ABV2D1G9_9SPHN